MALGGDVNIESPFSFGKSRLMYNDIADKIFALKSQLPATDNQFMLMFQDGMKFPPRDYGTIKNTQFQSRLNDVGISHVFLQEKLEELKEEGAGMPTVQELITELFKKDGSYRFSEIVQQMFEIMIQLNFTMAKF